MSARASKSQWHLTGQLLAVIAALTWSLLPALCHDASHASQLLAPVSGSTAHGASHDHSDDEGDACCHVVAGAKVIAPTATALPAVQVVVLSPSVVVAPIADAPSAHAKVARDATGPPRSESSRYFSYSPLAPPLGA